MSFSPPLRDEHLAGERFKAKWLACTRRRYFQLKQFALSCAPVSYTFCYAGLDPESLNTVTYGSDSELDEALVRIFTVLHTFG